MRKRKRRQVEEDRQRREEEEDRNREDVGEDEVFNGDNSVEYIGNRTSAQSLIWGRGDEERRI